MRAMSPSLKAVLALIFVAVLGAVLIRPILDAADAPLVAAPADEPSPRRSKRTAASPTPKPSPSRVPSPDPSAASEGGLISGPFRTQPLFDRYPQRCLPQRRAAEARTEIAVAGRTGVAVADINGSGRRDIGERTVLGFSLGGAEFAVSGSGGTSVYGFLDGEPSVELRDVKAWAYSPTSSCALALQAGRLVAEPFGPSRAVLVEGSVESFAFSPSGRRLAIVMEDDKTTSVWVADLNGATMREVQRQRTGARIEIKGWSADERTLYLTFSPGSGLSFVTFTERSAPPLSGRVVSARVTSLEQCGTRLLGVVSGAIAVISNKGPNYLTERKAGYTAVSCAPNGGFTAAIRGGDLVLLDGGGRELRDLTLDSGFRDIYVDWGDGGRGVLFGRVPAGGGAAQLWHIPEGGTARSTGLTFRPGPGGVDWSASPPSGIPVLSSP
jgi:hypothetical protein